MAKVYLDTGALVKLYIIEPGSEWVQKQLSQTGPIPINPLQLSELTNAILAASGRDFISAAAMRQTLRNLDHDLHAGRFLRETPDWTDVWQRADRLARAHTPTILCRTLDILHVAIAELTAVDLFITGDGRQYKLCEQIGLAARKMPAK